VQAGLGHDRGVLNKYWTESVALRTPGGQIMGGAINLFGFGEAMGRRGPYKRLLSKLVRGNKALMINR